MKKSATKAVYTNECAMPRCKKKEVVPFTCNICQKNFCIKHRFETDHNCEGPPKQSKEVFSAGLAAMKRFASSASGVETMLIVARVTFVAQRRKSYKFNCKE